MDYSDILKRSEYNFIKSNSHLGRHVILLGLAGSYSYGTNNENSDIDIRGVALNSKSDLIGMTGFEQYVDDKTDTTIYSFNKMVKLLICCNPNTIELLGLNPEHYLYLGDIGRELVNNSKMFLSKRAIQSFGGYADAQLRRLQNALARDNYPQAEKEKHILNSLKNAMYEFKSRYRKFEGGSLDIYIDKAVNPGFDTEIFIDTDLKHYPLRDYKNIWNEMNNIVKDYDKIGKRNKKKDDNHLNKHAMHLIRLFMMAVDILKHRQIRTNRRGDLDLLMKIRNGGFQKEDGTFRAEFYEIVADYEKRMEEAAADSALPDAPDMERVEAFVEYVNRKSIEIA